MRGVGERVGRPAAVVSALVLAAASASACSSSGSSGSSGGGGGTGSVKGMLTHIHDTPQTSSYLEFGDTAQVAKLNGGTAATSTGPFAQLLGRGAPDLAPYGQMLVPLTGIDAATATTAVSVGKPPNTVEILYGSFDADAIGGKLAAWGYRKQDRGGGVTAWVWRDDHQMDMSKLDPNTGVGPGMMGWFDVVWVSKSRIAYGGATADLTAALPEQSKPLSGDAVVGPLADCLGSALAGIVATGPIVMQGSAMPPAAYGVTAASTTDIREEICLAAPDDATAQKFAAAFTKQVGSGQDFRSNQPWAQLLSDPKSESLGGSKHVVRLSAKPVDPTRSGLVFDLVAQNDVETLLGLPMMLKDGRTVDPDGTISPAPSSWSSFPTSPPSS